MNQHPSPNQHCPDVSTEYQKRRQAVARISDTYDGLPRLFAVPVGDGTVAAWGIEFPDGSAVTCHPGGSGFGTWESPINAAAMLGGVQPLYLAGPEAWPYA